MNTVSNAPPILRLILTADQTSEIVRQAGGESHLGRVFVVMSPGSYPQAPGRLVLHFIECATMRLANDAVEVAQGTSRAVRPRRATGPPQAQECPSLP